MISPASDYRPIDKRPVRWSSAMDPLSLQKRGLVHWIPCGRIDVGNHRITDRRYRPAAEVVMPTSWLPDAYRGLYGAYIGGATFLRAELLPALSPDVEQSVVEPRAATAFFTPRVTAAPVTLTFWVRHHPALWQESNAGVEVFLGSDSVAWCGFYTWLSTWSFKITHAENTVFAEATIDLTAHPVSLAEWHFCAAVFVSNADRWAYFDGLAGPHSTVALTPTAPKDILRLGNIGTASGSYPPVYSVLRDIRVYDRALGESELAEMYRNPYDMWAQYDRDDDYQFFVTSAIAENIAPPALNVAVALHAPEIFAPTFVEVPAQTVATTLHTPSILADLGFQVSALTVAVTAQTPASVNFEEEVIVEDERELEPHNFKVRIVDYVGGDDLRISRTYTELPEGVSINKGYLTIKRLATSDDADAILQKQITASEGVAGQITDASTTGGSIELHFDLTSI